VLKLIEAGKTREDLWRLLMLTPACRGVDGDLRAMIGSTRIGAERLALLVEELGVDRPTISSKACWPMPTAASAPASIACTRRVAREEAVDNDCFEPIDGKIVVTLTVKDSRLIVDFAGTTAQLRGSKNSSIANSTSAVFMALSSFFEPDLPKNEGAFRGVEIRLPEGTMVNARAARTMNMNTVFIAHEIIHALWKALGRPCRTRLGRLVQGGACRHRGRAPDAAAMYVPVGRCAGRRRRRGSRRLSSHRPSHHPGRPHAAQLETYEQLYRCASAAGAALRQRRPQPFPWRVGLRLRVEIFTPADYAFRGEGVGAPSSFGAARRPRRHGRRSHAGPGRWQEIQAPKYGVERHGPGTYRALSPGGGGYGNARTRDPLRVLRDVRDGVVSAAAAERDYAVAIAKDGRSIDAARTAALRTAAE